MSATPAHHSIMKPSLCTVAALALAASLPAAEPTEPMDPATEAAVAALGMLPDQRGGLTIAPDERNPFAVKPKEVAKLTAPEDTETQESKIRSIFRDLRVTGIRRDRNGRHLALAGDLILRQGEEVKPVLEEQTEILIVSRIEPRQIELTFVETKDSTQPRVIVLPVVNQVQVAQKLFGQSKGKSTMYIARGRTAPTIEEAVSAIAGAPPTAPASASPTATATGTPPTIEPLEAAAAATASTENARRQAAAMAGLNEQALANLIDRGSSTAATPPAGPPAAENAEAPGAGAVTPAARVGEPAMESPPTERRRRTTPPSEEPASPARPGVVE